MAPIVRREAPLDATDQPHDSLFALRMVRKPSKMFFRTSRLEIEGLYSLVIDRLNCLWVAPQNREVFRNVFIDVMRRSR